MSEAWKFQTIGKSAGPQMLMLSIDQDRISRLGQELPKSASYHVHCPSAVGAPAVQGQGGKVVNGHVAAIITGRIKV